MLIVPVVDFIGKLFLQFHKVHHIQSLKNVGTMCWISDKFDVQLLSFLKKLKGEVRGVSIKKDHLCTAVCFLPSFWIETFSKPI